MVKYPQKDVIEILLIEDIKNGLKSEIMGREILILDETDSTNNIAKELAKNGATDGTAVIALSQKAGKGRMGRSFFSPKGKGIYMSLILCCDFSEINPLLITSYAAVSVARAVDKVCKTNTKIKWVNDLYLGGKKFCGILTESLIDFKTQKPRYVILGIGVNVSKTEFPKELCHIATSIENETGEEVIKSTLISEILNELDGIYSEIKTGEFLEESRKRSFVLGKNVKVIRGDEVYFAKAEGIDSCGGLILNINGKREVLSSGEVSIRVTDED